MQAIANGDAANADAVEIHHDERSAASLHPAHGGALAGSARARWRNMIGPGSTGGHRAEGQALASAGSGQPPRKSAGRHSTGRFVFATQNENRSAGLRLMRGSSPRQQTHAEKVALFLRRLFRSDERLSRHAARAAIRASCRRGIFSSTSRWLTTWRFWMRAFFRQADRRQIEDDVSDVHRNHRARERLWPDQQLERVGRLRRILLCARACRTWRRRNDWFSGPSGICDQLGKGEMDDGWWYECSISYNTCGARANSRRSALAYEPFGVNFLRPESAGKLFTGRVARKAELSGGVTAGTTRGRTPQTVRHGARKFTARTPNRIATIKMMWDSLLPFLD